MKLQIDAATFAGGLDKALGIVERAQTIPILGNVLLEADESGLTVTTTDLESRVFVTLPVEPGTPGACSVNATKLHAAAKRAPADSQASLSLGKQYLTVSAGSAKYRLATLPAEDFPLASNPDDPGVPFEVDGADLASLFGTTRFVVPTNDTRLHLLGVYFSIEMLDGQPHLSAVATDGHRLARFAIPAPDGLAGNVDAFTPVIVPRKSVFQICRLLKDFGGPVAITARKTSVEFTIGDTVFQTKLIDSQFPNWRRVVEVAVKDKSARVVIADLRESVERVSVALAGEKFPGMSFKLEGQAIELATRARHIGDVGQDKIEAVQVAGGDFEFGVNCRYLADTLAHWPADQVDIFASVGGAPVLFLPPGNEGSTEAPGALGVISPMKL